MQQQFLPITLIARGDEVTNCRYYPAKRSKKGVIFVGGIGGGFDSPAKNVYSKLAAKLCNEGISALRVQFRYPTLIEESVQDVLAGAKFLETEGASALGLVGHSFGGAVVIQAGVALNSVRTVVTLATQGYGAGAVSKLAPHASIFLLHGGDDETLPKGNSEFVYDLAGGKKRLLILVGNHHGLDESASQVYQEVNDWLKQELEK